MSRADIAVPAVLPKELAPGKLGSSDALIKSRRQVEFKPQQSNFVNLNPTPNQRTEFVLNAQDGFMDNSKSHLEFKLATYLYEGSAITSRALCTGGAHAAIRQITITDGSGTIISETPQYAKLYALMSNYTQSPQHVDSVGVYAGDSVVAFDDSYTGGINKNSMKMLFTTDSFILTTLSTAGVVAGLTGGAALSELTVGDYIRVLAYDASVAEAASYDLIVTAIGGNTTFTAATPADWSNLPPANLVAKDIMGIYRLDLHPSTRKYVANVCTTDISSATTTPGESQMVKVQLKLMNPFLQMQEYIPLRYMRNLRITIDWNPAWMLLMSGRRATTTTKSFGAIIVEPRYIASIVEPVEAVLADWNRRYESDEGIVYQFTDFASHIRYVSTSDNSNLQFVIPCTFVSTRSILSAFYLDSQMTQGSLTEDFVASSDTASWYGIDKTGITVAAHVDDYEYVVGSDRYPLDGRVHVDKLGGENLLHNLKTLQKSGDSHLQLRFSPIDQRGIHPSSVDKEVGYALGTSSSGTHVSTKRCLFSADFSKAGELSGVSLRSQDLQGMFYRNNAVSTNGWGQVVWGSALHLLSWIAHDRIMKISRSEGPGVRMLY